MKKLLQIFIVLLPLVVSSSTQDPSLSIRILFLSIFTSLIFLLLIFSKDGIDISILKNPFSIIYLLIIFSYFLSSYINGFTPEGKIIILNLYLFYLFLLFVLYLFRKFGIEFILKPILYFSLIISILYFIQVADLYLDLFGFNLEKKKLEFNKLASTMAHRNLMISAQFLCLPIIIYLYTISNKFFKSFCILSIVMFVSSLLLSNTRTGFFALFVFILIIIFFNRNFIKPVHYTYILLILILTIGVSFILLKTTDRYDTFFYKMERLLKFSESPRYKLYDNTLRMIKDNPIIGVGAGNWKKEIWKYDLYRYSNGKSLARRPHNDFLWKWSEGGVIAFISYILLFLIMLRESYLRHINSEGEERFLYSLLFSVTVGYAIISFFDSPMERVPHNLLFLIISAIVLSKGIKNPKKKIEIPKYIIVISFLISTYSITFSYNRYQKDIYISNAIQFKKEGSNNLLIKSISKAYDREYSIVDNNGTPLLWYRGVGFFNLQMFDKALSDFNSALDVNPNHVYVLNDLASVFENKGKHSKAKEYYNKALEIIPTFKESRINLAAILYNEKEYEQALNVILESKVAAYRKRIKNNDNYDKYLKIIVNSWAKNINDISEEDYLIVKDLLNSFDETPDFAEKKMREVKSNRDTLNISYLDALLETYKK